MADMVASFLKKHFFVVGDRMAKHLFTSVFGGAAAMALVAAAQILAARFLGPETFGNYSLAMAIAVAISTFLVLEADAGAVPMIAMAKERGEQEKIVSSLFVFFSAVAFFVCAVVAAFSGVIAQAFHIAPTIVLWGAVLAFVIVLKRLGDTVLRGCKLFFIQAVAKNIEGVATLVFLFVFMFLAGREFESYVFAVGTGGVISLIFLWQRCRYFFSARAVSAASFRRVWIRTRSGALNAFSNFFLKSFDKFAVAGFLGAEALGLYAAYALLAVTLSARVLGLLANVALPSVSGKESAAHAFRAANVFFLKMVVPVFFAAIVFLRAGVWFFGSAYAIEWGWIFFLALYMTAHLVTSSYGWILTGHSRKGYRRYNRALFFGALFFAIGVLGAEFFGVFSVGVLTALLAANRIVVGALHFRDLRGVCV